MGKFKDAFKFLESELMEPSQAKNLRDVYHKLHDNLDKNIFSPEHAMLQLLCAKEFINQGYEVDVECELTQDLVCDIRSVLPDSSLIAEVETGYYFDPDRALVGLEKPRGYRIDKSFVRTVSKISRYSVYSDQFAMVVYDKRSAPNYACQSKMLIPSMLLDPPMLRDNNHVKMLKSKSDEFYTKPKISEEHIRYGRIDYVYVVNTENLTVKKFDLKELRQHAYRNTGAHANDS